MLSASRGAGRGPRLRRRSHREYFYRFKAGGEISPVGRALARHRVANPVVLSGDIHRGIAAELKQDFDNPDSATVGVEFAGSSLSSGGNGQDMDPLGLTFLAANPHIKFNNTQRGYMRCTLDRETWRTDYRTLEYVLQPGAPVFTRRSFVVDEGTPALLDG
jgi:alkaline phosphatase D